MSFLNKVAKFAQDVVDRDDHPQDQQNNNHQASQQQQQYSQQQQQYGQQQQSQQQPQKPQGGQQNNDDDDGIGFRLPSQVLQMINNYVDTFAPGIAKGIADEVQEFEAATLHALQGHVKEAIIGLFHGDASEFQSNNSISEFKGIRAQPQNAANLPQYNYPSINVVASRDSQGTNLPEYGSRGLPFAGGSSASAVAPPNAQNAPQEQKNIFENALHKVKAFAKDKVDDVQDEIEEQVKKVADQIDDISDHIEEKVDRIIPDIKEKVQAFLKALHLGLAEKMTQAALACLKFFMAGVIRLEEIGETAVEGVTSLFSKLLDRDGDDNQVQAQGQQQEQPKGPTGLFSNKLSHGLTTIRRGSREDFRKFLIKIEEELFESLPDGLKEPLSKIFGGNPFDTTDRAAAEAHSGRRHSGLLGELAEKIQQILRRIQQGLRDRILEVVSGGHRRLEDRAWANVQDAVVTRIRQYVPNVQVQLKDE